MLGEFQDYLEFDKLPVQFENLKALKCLHTSRIGSKQQPSSPKSSNIISLLPYIIELCSLTKLRQLVLGGCNLSEDEFSIEFGCLHALNVLDLSRNNFFRGCGVWDQGFILQGWVWRAFPCRGSLISKFFLSRNNFCNLPRLINGLPGLRDLSLHECITLQSISLHTSVLVLRANGCTSLKRILILINQSSAGSFKLNNCNKLVEIQSLKSLGPQSDIYMGRCNNLAYDFRKSFLHVLSLPLFVYDISTFLK